MEGISTWPNVVFPVFSKGFRKPGAGLRLGWRCGESRNGGRPEEDDIIFFRQTQ